MHRDAYTGGIIGFIAINYISEEFIFEEKRVNEVSENKFSLKITRYTVPSKSVSSMLRIDLSTPFILVHGWIKETTWVYVVVKHQHISYSLWSLTTV